MEDMSPARPRLILASQSPRRRQLLAEYGLVHEAVHPGIDDAELLPGRVAPAQWVAALAYLKAAAGLELLRGRGLEGPLLILGADTACVKGSRLIGTPTDAAEAEETIRALQDGVHDVVTGVALIRQSAPTAGIMRQIFADRARVTVGHIGEDRIREYVASEQWRGKAGGYNLVERIEAGWPIEYEGDPTTVMGLPMRALMERLASLEHAAP
jgi:septum formation protein